MQAEHRYGRAGGRAMVMAKQRDKAALRSGRRQSGRRRLNWVLLVLFTYLALESAVFGLALGGPWLVLLAPGLVCGCKAFETWGVLNGRPTRRQQRRQTARQNASLQSSARL